MSDSIREQDRENVVGRIELASFRNYRSLTLELSAGLNILFGQNAQGKTNLLEGLYLLASTRLLRGSRDSEAILEGEDRAQITAELQPNRTEITIVLQVGRKKTALLNRMKLPRAADLIGRLPCICVSAFDMAIVRGGPEDRRLFLDLELSQLSPAYLNHLAQYKRSLEHRNALLRRAQECAVSTAEYEPWEAAIAEHGAPIRAHRLQMLEELAPQAEVLQGTLALDEALEVRYEPKDPATGPEELAAALQEARARDIARGSTSVGPHRDDLALLVEGRDARYFGSQGQQRTAVLALKLACHQRQAAIRGQAPLLLLDDILSDLDEGRRGRLVEWLLQNARQAVLTCTDPEAAGRDLLRRASLWKVQNGTMQPA